MSVIVIVPQVGLARFAPFSNSQSSIDGTSMRINIQHTSNPSMASCRNLIPETCREKVIQPQAIDISITAKMQKMTFSQSHMANGRRNIESKDAKMLDQDRNPYCACNCVLNAESEKY
jgi:hypothetical protein